MRAIRTGPGTAYGRLVCIELRHLFGSDGPGRCTDLAIAPTPLTARRLAAAGMLVRPSAAGLEILLPGQQLRAFVAALEAHAANPGSGRAHDIAGGLFEQPLLFTLRLLEPSFLQVAALPRSVGGGGAALLFSNRASLPLPQRGVAPAAALTQAGVVAFEAKERHDTDPEEPEVRQPAGEIPHLDSWWYEPAARTAEAQAEREQIRSDPTRLPLAIVEIFLADPSRDRPSGGRFPIAFNADDGRGDEIGKGFVSPVRYVAEFKPRSTRWRYVVVDTQGTLDEGSFSLNDSGSPPVTFTREHAPPVPGARGAAAFVSDAPLALRPAGRRFVLKGAARASPSRPLTLVDPLPAPGRSATPSRDPSDGTEISEIYIYL